jgi:hypothetical protein
MTKDALTRRHAIAETFGDDLPDRLFRNADAKLAKIQASAERRKIKIKPEHLLDVALRLVHEIEGKWLELRLYKLRRTIPHWFERGHANPYPEPARKPAILETWLEDPLYIAAYNRFSDATDESDILRYAEVMKKIVRRHKRENNAGGKIYNA